MRTNKGTVAALMTLLLIGISGYLVAQPSSTTQPAPMEDVTRAQEAMQKLLEQGPPVTTPTVPGGQDGEKAEGQIYSPRSRGKNKLLAPPPSIVPSGRGQLKHPLLPEGHYIADRRGRLTNTNDYWLFVFESDGKALTDPPIKILPNRWLEKMEADLAASRESHTFRVSGEITTYHGQNFLLLRKVLVERELGESPIK